MSSSVFLFQFQSSFNEIPNRSEIPIPKISSCHPLLATSSHPGVDDNPQILVANAFKARAALKDPQYILNVGDNFYWGGIEKTCGEPMNKRLGHSMAIVVLKGSTERLKIFMDGSRCWWNMLRERSCVWMLEDMGFFEMSLKLSWRFENKRKGSLGAMEGVHEA